MKYTAADVKIFIHSAFRNGCRLGIEHERGEGVDHSTNSPDMKLIQRLWLESRAKKDADRLQEIEENPEMEIELI